MTNLTIKYLVQHIFRMYGKPLEMSLEEFNNLLAFASDELFKEMASGYQQGNGAEVDARVTAALNPFRMTRYYTLGTSSNDLLVSASKVTLNTDDYMILSAWLGASNLSAQEITVLDIITPSELEYRIGNAITYPSTTYPVMIMSKAWINGSSDGVRYAYIIPEVSTTPTNQTLRVMSLKKPTTPSLVLTYSNGVETQSSSSVALEWDSVFHVDIVRKMLQYLGLSVGNQLILEAVENQNLKEK